MVITNIPNPYRLPLFNILDDRLKGMGINLKVIFAGRGYERRKWVVDMETARFDYSFLKPSGIKHGKAGKVFFLYNGILAEIRKEKPGIIIVIGFSLATLRLWALSFIKKTRFIIWSGSIDTKGRKDSFFRRLYRRLLICRAYGFIAYGSRAKEYLQNLGAAAEKIQIAINTTDTEFYRKETEALRRRSPGDGENKPGTLLYIGHLTYKKRLDLLFSALKQLSGKRRDFKLVIVGDGPYRQSLEQLAAEMEISDLIGFEGFRQKPEIPGYLSQADCFLFPSEYDIWGLVLVEAMAAGLPCISSIHSGATHDLIIEGKTGFAMDFADTVKVSDRIGWVLDHPGKTKQIGVTASRFIREHAALENSVEGFIRAINPEKNGMKKIKDMEGQVDQHGG